MNNQKTIYILPSLSESQEAEVITVKDEKIYYRIFDTKELGEIDLFAAGPAFHINNLESAEVEKQQEFSWTASSLHADLHDAYIEKGFNH